MPARRTTPSRLFACWRWTKALRSEGRAARPSSARQGELEALETAFRAVRDERRSRTLIVLGEAGLGKTRLASEFVASLGEQASALVGRCVSYGEGATYLPLAESCGKSPPNGRRRRLNGCSKATSTQPSSRSESPS